MPQGVRRDLLVLQRRSDAAGGAGVVGEEERDRVAAERAAAAGREQRVLGSAVALLQPLAKHGDGLAGQRRRSCFRPFPRRSGCAGRCRGARPGSGGGELGDPQPGLDRDGEQRVVAAADPPGRSGAASSASTSSVGEVGDGRAFEPFGRDRDHAAISAACSGWRNAAYGTSSGSPRAGRCGSAGCCRAGVRGDRGTRRSVVRRGPRVERRGCLPVCSCAKRAADGRW